ncbi:MAG: hypothetical protein LAP21_11670 [Acidobacteriia bacterium]|nr:hypothetical protein [Terriglobia bacterium]
MTRNSEDRVLSRLGARELNAAEVERVIAAGTAHTNVCSFNPLTGARDGDAC